MSIDRNTIFDNSPNPSPSGPWKQQTFPEEKQQTFSGPPHFMRPGTADVAWNPYQETGDPEMGYTSELDSYKGNMAAAFIIEPALK